MSPRSIIVAVVLATAALALACGGNGDEDDGDGNGSGATTTETSSDGNGEAFTLDQAETLLQEAALKAEDLPGAWAPGTDTTQDNAAADAAAPEQAASNERCGRLLGRTVTYMPEDVITAFIGGETLSFFDTMTVYETAGGAADCSAEAAARFQEPGELARAFGNVFIDPSAVQVAPFEYPMVADGSFAATLTGQIDAMGTPINITILLVGFLQGNTTAAVGSARSGSIPPAEELTPLVNLTIDRIRNNQ
jgi:hypothetical protein